VLPEAKGKISAREIILAPVYFAFDNFNLNESGKLQMEKIKGYLSEYPVARVRLIGHADAKGPAEYNLVLSEKRAEVAKKYLVSLGIEAGRIETSGMGEKNFAAINSNADGSDNPEGRRLNRRVEYEIIGPENSPIIIHMTPVPGDLKYRQ
jgi:outer membrane protein OmpA-like peptidoglycan-associated protein